MEAFVEGTPTHVLHVSKIKTSFMDVLLLYQVLISSTKGSMEVGFRGSCRGSRSDSVQTAEAYVEVKR